MISLYNYKLIELAGGETIIEGRIGSSTGPLWRTSVLKDVKKNYVITVSGKLYHLATPAHVDDDTRSITSHFVDQVKVDVTGERRTSTVTSTGRRTAGGGDGANSDLPIGLGDLETPTITPIKPAQIGSGTKRSSMLAGGESSTPLSRKRGTLLMNRNDGEFKRPAPVATRSPVVLNNGLDLKREYQEKMRKYLQLTQNIKEIEHDLTRIETVAQSNDTIASASVQSTSVTELMDRRASRRIPPVISEEIAQDLEVLEVASEGEEGTLSIPTRPLSVERWLHDYSMESEQANPPRELSTDKDLPSENEDADESVIAPSWVSGKQTQNMIYSSDSDSPEFTHLRKRDEERLVNRHTAENVAKSPRNKQEVAVRSRKPRTLYNKPSTQDPHAECSKRKTTPRGEHRERQKTKSKRTPNSAASSMPPPACRESMDDTLMSIGISSSTYDNQNTRRKGSSSTSRKTSKRSSPLQTSQKEKSRNQAKCSSTSQSDSGFRSRSGRQITLPEGCDESFWTKNEIAMYDEALLDVRADKFISESDYWIAVSKRVKTKTWRECKERFEEASRNQKRVERERRLEKRSGMPYHSTNSRVRTPHSSADQRYDREDHRASLRKQAYTVERTAELTSSHSQRKSPHGQRERGSTKSRQHKKERSPLIISAQSDLMPPQDRRTRRHGANDRSRPHSLQQYGNRQSTEHIAKPSRNRQSSRGKSVQPPAASDSFDEDSEDSIDGEPSGNKRLNDRQAVKRSGTGQRSRGRVESEEGEEEEDYESTSRSKVSGNSRQRREQVSERGDGKSGSRHRVLEKRHRQTNNGRDDVAEDEREYRPLPADKFDSKKYKHSRSPNSHRRRVPTPNENIHPDDHIKLAGKKTFKRKEQLSEMVERINEGYSPGLFDSATPLAPNSKRYRLANVEMTPLNVNNTGAATDMERRRLLASDGKNRTTTDRDNQRRMRKESHKFLKSLRLDDVWPISKSRERPLENVSRNANKYREERSTQRLLEEREAADDSSEGSDSLLTSSQQRASYYSDN